MKKSFRHFTIGIMYLAIGMDKQMKPTFRLALTEIIRSLRDEQISKEDFKKRFSPHKHKQ